MQDERALLSALLERTLPSVGLRSRQRARFVEIHRAHFLRRTMYRPPACIVGKRTMRSGALHALLSAYSKSKSVCTRQGSNSHPLGYTQQTSHNICPTHYQLHQHTHAREMIVRTHLLTDTHKSSAQCQRVITERVETTRAHKHSASQQLYKARVLTAPEEKHSKPETVRFIRKIAQVRVLRKDRTGALFGKIAQIRIGVMRRLAHKCPHVCTCAPHRLSHFNSTIRHS
jgi:hypothetical protein